MTHPPSDVPSHPTRATSLTRLLLGRVLIPGLITVAGIAGAMLIFKTRPVTETAPPVRTARLVETIVISPSSYQVEIEAMGLVKAKDRIELRPRISGEIVSVSERVIPGATCEAGTLLFRIDPTDYEIALRTQQANRQQEAANFMIEKGQQRIAAIDFEIASGELSPEELDLVLRKPQLMQAQARSESAAASLELAELNLARTQIAAPFDALILARNTSLGSVVSPSTTLATLVDSSEFWVELTLPVRDTRWIPKPSDSDTNAIEVRLMDELAWGRDAYRTGEVIGTSLDVDPESRMAKVVVRVDDPLALRDDNRNQPSLLLGSFVRGVILGNRLDDVVVLHRDHLRQGNILWTLDAANRLVFSEVEVLYTGSENVVVRNRFQPNTRLITSNLSVPVEGMLLRYEAGEPGDPIPTDTAPRTSSTPRS